MARKHPPFTPEFRRQMIELVRSGRSPESLANEFEPTAQTIRNWVAQAGRDAGERDDGTMPIRLFPIPTKCRVVPFSRVEPVEGRRCGSAGDSEQ